MKKYIPSTLFIVLLSTLLSCAKEQPKVAWLKLDKWDLIENEDALYDQGELSHDLSQVFISVDGRSIGGYELPCKIPIVASTGDHELVLTPAIIINGIAKTKERYPFAKNQEVTIHLVQGDTVSFTPTTQYYNSTQFLIEDFESPSMQIEVSDESVGTVGRNDDPEILQWGNKYGEIILTDEDSLVLFVTNFGKQLPKYGTNVYLEFDYMNVNSALISTVSYGNGNFFIDHYLQVNPNLPEEAKWKHMYVDLTENISYRQNTPYNEVQFTLLKDYVGASRYFYLDNIKIIYP